jgi:hypothetical protein
MAGLRERADGWLVLRRSVGERRTVEKKRDRQISVVMAGLRERADGLLVLRRSVGERRIVGKKEGSADLGGDGWSEGES